MSLNILTRFHINILITPLQSVLNFLLGISKIFVSSASTRNWQDYLCEGMWGLQECLRCAVLCYRYSFRLFSSVGLKHSVLSHLWILANIKTDASHLSSIDVNQSFLSVFYFLQFRKFIFNRNNFILQSIKCTLERNSWLMGVFQSTEHYNPCWRIIRA